MSEQEFIDRAAIAAMVALRDKFDFSDPLQHAYLSSLAWTQAKALAASRVVITQVTTTTNVGATPVLTKTVTTP